VPALQVANPELKPQSHQKKGKNKIKKITNHFRFGEMKAMNK
jgi:hypothetical protein